MTERRRIFVLNNPNAPRLSPELADEIGLPESIILLQLEFWISISNHYIEDKWWTYQSIRDIQKTFVFWSPETINRAIKSLLKQELIEVGNFNQKRYDKTRWFCLCEHGIRNLLAVKITDTLSQNKTTLSSFEPPSGQTVTTIPEITPKTTSQITSETNILKKKYGLFDNVFLTDMEYEGLKVRLGPDSTLEWIETLSGAIASKGYKYKSHYATILNWDRRQSAAQLSKANIGRVKSDDPDKYIKGIYGHMVMRNEADRERIHGKRQRR